MNHKVILLADPGIDTAFAVGLALWDPRLAVHGLLAIPGNVKPEQATQNVHLLIDQFDPPRWPRLGAALGPGYDIDGMQLHGPDGLGGAGITGGSLHSPTSSEKLLSELAHLSPKELTVICLGPLTTLARAFDRDPELPSLIQRIVAVGGCWHEPGNAGPVAEFHFACDPAAARQVLHAGVPLTLIPLDVTRKMLFAPTELLDLPCPESKTCRFLRQIVPFGIRATSNLYGLEGFHLKDVLGVAAVAMPGAVALRPMHVDVETRGELTRGMSVIDSRPVPANRPNVELAVGIDLTAVKEYVNQTLRLSA